MNHIKNSAVVFLLVSILFAPMLYAQFDFDVETGAVFSGYNDVRIPGEGGTLFSLSKDLQADSEFFYRIRLFYDFNPRHHLGVLFAPLSIHSTGQLGQDLVFFGETFAANTPLQTTWMFNSYRLVYRYDFLRRERLELGIGFTAKIRDALIRVEGNGLEAEKTNVGFVPILHFRAKWRLSDRVALLLDGDALAAPQGRAEDILAALMLQVNDRIELKAGYRLLEGGADNEEVYNFALVHYAAFGAVVSF